MAALLAGLGTASCVGGEGDAATTEERSLGAPHDNATRTAWGEVTSKVASVVSAHKVPGLGLVVYDANDEKVYEQMFGDFSPDRRVPIASASKLVSGLVLFHLVDEGRLSLDATTGEILGWVGPKSRITLRHLLSFTSGLPAQHPCISNPNITLAECVDRVAFRGLAALPGRQLEYGPVHLTVAGRMAEIVTGKPWNTLFRETLGAPLGIPRDVRYYTLPRPGIGTTNPRVAAGLQASMNEYAPLLAVAFHEGTYRGHTFASRALFQEQATEPFPYATIAYSPFADIGLPYRYGLASWLECPPPARACKVLSSPGAWGFTPWFDRDAGYYALIGTFLDSSGEAGIVDFTVELAQELKSSIRTALGR
jgi:serine-type D-Ala-D-Ala carboxypeptidase/endopeptidase